MSKIICPFLRLLLYYYITVSDKKKDETPKYSQGFHLYIPSMFTETPANIEKL